MPKKEGSVIWRSTAASDMCQIQPYEKKNDQKQGSWDRGLYMDVWRPCSTNLSRVGAVTQPGNTAPFCTITTKPATNNTCSGSPFFERPSVSCWCSGRSTLWSRTRSSPEVSPPLCSSDSRQTHETETAWQQRDKNVATSTTYKDLRPLFDIIDIL